MADPSQPWEKRIMLVHLFDNFIVDMHLNQTEACVMMSSVSLSMTEKMPRGIFTIYALLVILLRDNNPGFTREELIFFF